MSLAHACRHDFDSLTRDHGEAHFRQKRIEMASHHGHSCGFTVDDPRGGPYDVSLNWGNLIEGLVGSCTCGQFEREESCQHIWAAVRVADTMSLLRGVRIPKFVDFYSVDEVEADSDDDDDEETPDEVFEKSILSSMLGRLPVNAVDAIRSKLGGVALPLALPGKIDNWRSVVQKTRVFTAPEGTPNRAWLALTGLKRGRLSFLLDLTASTKNQQVTVRTFLQKEFAPDQWSDPQPCDLGNEIPALLDSPILRLADLLGNAAPEQVASPFPWMFDQSGSECGALLNRQEYELILRPLCESGRLWVGEKLPPFAKLAERSPVSWLAGPPLEFSLEVERVESRKLYQFHGRYTKSNGQSIRPNFAFPEGLVTGDNWVGAWNAADFDCRWVYIVNSPEGLLVPFADRDALLSELWRGGAPPKIVGDKSLVVEAEFGNPRGVLEVKPAPPKYNKYDRGPRELSAKVLFNYPGEQIPPESMVAGGYDPETQHAWLRNPERETELISALANFGATARPDPGGSQILPENLLIPAAKLPEIVHALVTAGWEVKADNARYRAVGEFNYNISSGVDWFDLETNLSFDGVSASLPQLLKALQQGEGFVTLGDGSRGMLPQEWLKQIAPLAEFGEVAEGKLRFKPSQALLLDALLASREDQVQLECDEQFRTLRTKLQSFSGVQPSEPSATFQGELRPYQKLGLGWLEFLAEHRLGGCLADDMGLGKTVQVLARLEQRRLELLDQPAERRPSLAVVPKSLVYNWQLEAQKFAPELKVGVYHGADRKTVVEDLTQHDLLITTYGTMLRDIEELRQQPFDYVILDESQAIKNSTSQSAKAVRLLDARHRLAMSGTPVENHLGELWSLFEFLNPGMLGRSEAFRSLGRGGGDPAQMDLLRRGIAPFLLRRTKSQVLADLPAKTEQTVYCDLEPAQRKAYNQLRDHYRASLLSKVSTDGIKRAQIQVLEALLRLRQAACHPGLLDEKQISKSSAKLDALFEQLDEVVNEGHKVLVFSQFTSLLAIVKTHLDKRKIVYEYLDGKTRNRQAKVDRFQTDPQCPLFLISLKAGGTGLNLTAADYVYLLDPWWNPAVEAQAIDRAHRIGQEKPVFAYRLIARDTVEDKILELQTRKRDLADAIIAADGGLVSQMTAEDLQLLLT